MSTQQGTTLQTTDTAIRGEAAAPMARPIYFYTHLDSDYQLAADRLTGDPGIWLPEPAEANGLGYKVELSADGALPGAVDHMLARVEMGPADRTDRSVRRAVRWRAASAQRLFPALTAELQLDALGGHGCRLALMGTYRPPLSVVGELGDRVLGHRVAEACARRFVLDVAGRLQLDPADVDG